MAMEAQINGLELSPKFDELKNHPNIPNNVIYACMLKG